MSSLELTAIEFLEVYVCVCVFVNFYKRNVSNFGRRGMGGGGRQWGGRQERQRLLVPAGGVHHIILYTCIVYNIIGTYYIMYRVGGGRLWGFSVSAEFVYPYRRGDRVIPRYIIIWYIYHSVRETQTELEVGWEIRFGRTAYNVSCRTRKSDFPSTHNRYSLDNPRRKRSVSPHRPSFTRPPPHRRRIARSARKYNFDHVRMKAFPPQ